MNYTATVDGGGGLAYGVPCYCSVHLAWDGQVRLWRFDLPRCRTSNEAEYAAVIAALETVCEKFPRNLTSSFIHIRTDSLLVVKQCTGEWRVKAMHLLKFRDRILELAGRFEGVEFQWTPRAKIKEVLGH